jgi:hypothetical protein
VRILGSPSPKSLAFLNTVAKSAGVKPLRLSTKLGGSAPVRFCDLTGRHRQETHLEQKPTCGGRIQELRRVLSCRRRGRGAAPSASAFH